MRRAVVDPRFPTRLRELRNQRGHSLRSLSAVVFYSKSLIQELETGASTPTVELARRLDDALEANGELIALARPADREHPRRDVNDGLAARSWETVELLRRVQASDSSPATIEALHGAVFELCCQYSWRDARELRVEGHGWLSEVVRLLRLPVGLREHRELLVVAGWLALLVGCVEYDMGMRAGSEATRLAARQLGEEAGHSEIVAWSWEMSAWFALTQGRYPDVLTAAEAGQIVAGEHTAAVQLIAQEAKARARMGDLTGVRAALERGRRLLDMFPRPERPDHHFVVDPDKWDFYAMDAYRLAGDDDLAEHHARQVLVLGTGPDGAERAPMRMAEARLTLGAVAARAHELEQAVHVGLAALQADRRSLPSLLMVAAELNTELRRHFPGEQPTDEFREALRAIYRR